MKLLLAAILFIFVAFLGIQTYSFLKQSREVYEEYTRLTGQLKQAEAEYERLRAELEYYLRPENLEKELRARFNYRAPDEKLIIIVPTTSSPRTPQAP